MDVRCTTCGEPWDTYHLWHDAIWETGLSDEEIRRWQSLPPIGKLSAPWRSAFEAVGYVFGRSVINVIRCPSCPKDARPDIAKLRLKAEIEALLAGDEDGLAAAYEDHGL